MFWRAPTSWLWGAQGSVPSSLPETWVLLFPHGLNRLVGLRPLSLMSPHRCRPRHQICKGRHSQGCCFPWALLFSRFGVHLTPSVSSKTASLFAKTFVLLFVPSCLLKTASLFIAETLVWTQVSGLTPFTSLFCFVVHVSNEAFCRAKLQTDSIVLIVSAFIERFNTACI